MSASSPPLGPASGPSRVETAHACSPALMESEWSRLFDPPPSGRTVGEVSMLRPEARAIEILIVEDNPGDVRLTQEALKNGDGRLTQLNVVRDGEEALAYLRREGSHAEAIRPDLIVLDLNLPRKDGREVLGEIKADEHLRRIPVAILTTSNAEVDILRAYELHANCYVIKPVGLEEYITTVRSINTFWAGVVKLPPHE